MEQRLVDKAFDIYGSLLANPAVPGPGKQLLRRLVRTARPTYRVLRPVTAIGPRVLIRIYRSSRSLAAHQWNRARWMLRHLQYAALMVRPARGPDLYLAVSEINRVYRTAAHFDVDVYLANDWHMLPVAMRLAQERRVQFGYDTHEYALEEYKYRWQWRLTRRPMARSVEAKGLRESMVASTVSEGIAEDMARTYQVPGKIIVIRNAPEPCDVKSGPTGHAIKVLYHGLITIDRGLEECVRSVALWRPEFTLILRGPGSPEVMNRLRDVAREAGVTDRVVFDPPVPMLALVSAAANADIGISTPPKTSKHNIFALPNKLFEYIQAGLAICVCDLPDMARIVKRYDLGYLIDDVSPEAIAAGINKFDRAAIDRFKANTRMAAETLNWAHEKDILVGSYSRALVERLSKGPAASVGSGEALAWPRSGGGHG
jgi:glycosyltransferase involved in cell wall biosynthesis